MSVFHNPALLGSSGSSGYKIERSLRFNSADSAYLNRTPASAGSQTTWTWSAWIKRAALSGTTYRLFGTGDNNSATNQTSINLSSDSLDFYNVNGGNKTTTAKFRDPSAWYHVVVAWDSNNATAGDRIRLYVNGVRLTSFSSSADPSSGTNTVVNSAVSHTIGTLPTNSGNYFDGYLTEINFIDGQALTPSSFGETDTITGVWKPKRYSGAYTGNSFYLKFADNSGTTSTTLGKDSSGLGNNFTPNNFSVTAGAGNDSMIDTPTPYADGGNGRGNYATLSPFQMATSGPIFTLSNGNLDYSCAASSGNAGRMWTRGTMSLHTGKTYWEVKVTSTNCAPGICDTGQMTDSTVGALKYIVLFNAGQAAYNTSATYTGTTFAFAVNDIIGFAFDGAARTLACYNNNTLIGTWSGIDSAVTWLPACGVNASASSTSMEFNFGQRAFAYTPPSGFKALNTQNLPEPTIKKPSSYMDVVTYTGTGAEQTISSLGFSPDLIWIKDRNTARSHYLANSIIGGGNYLSSDSTSQELTTAEGIKSINSNGFTLGYALLVNNTSETYAAWCWDKSATPGFDIVTFTAQATATTVAHSLGVAPKFIIMKDRDTAAYPWLIYHSDVGIQKYLQFSTASSTTASTAFSTAPTSTVFDPGTGVTTGNGYNRLVAYLWSEVAGFSKFGSYTGNGSTDGPFVYCGFRPRWAMIKNSSGVGDWNLYDAARLAYNANDTVLFPNLSSAEQVNTGAPIDILSSGFKIRATAGNLNTSSSTYIFCAFAETPAKYSLAR